MERSEGVVAGLAAGQDQPTTKSGFAQQVAPGRQQVPASAELKTSASSIDNILVTAQGSLCHRSGDPQQKEPLITEEGDRNCLEMKPP